MGRARYERRPERQRGLRNYDSGLRNGFRPRHVQTAEGELRIEVPQARGAVLPFVSKLFPKWHCRRLLRTDPLKALVIGGFVRGLSMRDVESLCEEAGLGKGQFPTRAVPATLLLPRCDSDGAGARVDRELACAAVVPMHRAPPVRPTGASVGRP